MPWSVQYPKGTNAHFHQWISGMIDENATFSSNIHPVQLYEMFFLFLIAFIVWRTRNFWKKKASALLFSLFLFFIFRFSIEFLRDPATSVFGNKIIFGVRLFQWLLLISGFVCALILFVNEKYFISRIIERSTINPSLGKSIIYIFILSVSIFVCHGLFSRFELVSLDLMFIPAILLMAYFVFKSLAKAKFRLAATSFFIVPLFLITQTFFPDSAKTTRSLKSFYQNEVKTYRRIDFGTSIGDYYNELQYNPHEGQCGTAYTTEDYKHEFRMAGAGISFISREGKITTTKGINLYGGSNKEMNFTTHQENSYFLFGVNPYVKYDLKWLGFGAGLHVGNLRWVPLSPINEITFNRGTRFSPIMPEASLRLGRHDILDLRYDFGFNFPTTFPLLAHGLSIGSGFGNKTNFDVRYGLELSNKNGFLQQFFSAEGLLSRQIGIRLKYSFGHASFYSYSSTLAEYKDFQRIQLGLNYRFGFNASPGKAGTK
jgi:Prolipoprotein diacylglyceryltransferase